MALLNPVVSKAALTTVGQTVEIYVCPAGKSHAILDLSFLKDSLTGSSLIAVAISTNSNPAALTTVDYPVDDIELVNQVNSAELNKLVVGVGERVYVKLISGNAINVRMSGVEENNPLVLKAGRLAAMAIAGTAQTKVYENALANTAYISASMSIYNPNAATAATIQAWVTSGASPSASDKIVNIEVAAESTVIVENLLMSANEKIFVQSTLANSEYFVTGMVISTS